MTGGGRRPLLVVYRALGLGDFLTGVPALRALARAFPGHRRVLAAPAAIAPLAALTGAVDEVADTAPLAPLGPALQRANVAVNLHGRGPESHRVLLAAAPARLIAFAQPAAGVRGPEWRAGEHEVARWCRLLAESGIPADPSELDLPAPALPVPANVRGATVIHPGAASAARRWPAERWAAVARAERSAGRAVVVTGGPGEEPLAAEVAALAGLPAGAVLAGRTDLAQLAATVAAAGRVACGDTGMAHLATAMGTPSVVLFGPTPPGEWGPPADRPWHRALWAGRRGDPHAGAPDPGLLEIGPGDVAAALADIEASARVPRGQNLTSAVRKAPPSRTRLQRLGSPVETAHYSSRRTHMNTLEETLTWRGQDLRGTDGEKIGTIEEIYLDTDTNQPEWALVHTGLFGTKRSFVPLREATSSGDGVSVAFDKSLVKDAPSIDPDGQLSQSEEEQLYRHYGLAYGESRSGSGLPEGDAGTRGDIDLDRDRDRDIDMEGDARGTVGHDVSGPTTDEAMTRSEEELDVGKTQREAGRARLRKYVVEDEVTRTVPVQREEVRIEREPITDANVDAATSGPDISSEEHEVVLHEEDVVAEKRVVPKERVRLDKDVTTEEREVSETVRREEFDVDDDATRR